MEGLGVDPLEAEEVTEPGNAPIMQTPL